MFIITLMFFLHNTSAQNTEVQGTFSDRFTCIMLQKTPWDQGFVCVWVGRRLKGEGRGGGGVSAREPTDMFSTSASAARLEMRRNMEVEWQIGEGEREPSLMWSLLPWHMYSQQKVLRSSICSASLLYPARLRTELDLEHQDAAESGLNIKGQSYCMSKRRLRRGANNTAYSAWDAATWHDDRLLLVFFTVYGDRQTYYTSPNKARVVPRGSRHVLFCFAVKKIYSSCSAATRETNTGEAISQSLTPHLKISHFVHIRSGCLHLRSDSSQSTRNMSLLLCLASHPLFCCDDSGNESLLHSGLLHISKHTSTLSGACGEHRASEVW